MRFSSKSQYWSFASNLEELCDDQTSHSGEKSNQCEQCDYASSRAIWGTLWWSDFALAAGIHTVEKSQTNVNNVIKTHCQDECRSLSGGVTKNLTLHWMKKIFFSFYHQKEEIRSFPTMYNTWGCFLVRFGWTKWFIQKSTLKWGFFLDTVLDHLTSEAAGTHNFKDIANFHRCFEKSGT